MSTLSCSTSSDGMRVTEVCAYTYARVHCTYARMPRCACPCAHVPISATIYSYTHMYTDALLSLFNAQAENIMACGAMLKAGEVGAAILHMNLTHAPVYVHPCIRTHAHASMRMHPCTCLPVRMHTRLTRPSSNGHTPQPGSGGRLGNLPGTPTLVFRWLLTLPS